MDILERKWGTTNLFKGIVESLGVKRSQFIVCRKNYDIS